MKPEHDEQDKSKRRFLIGATSLVGGVYAGGLAYAFLSSFGLSEKAKAVGAPVEFDTSKLKAGQMATVTWRGKPIWILRRTNEAVDTLKTMDDMVLDPQSDGSDQPEYVKNTLRSYADHEDIFVAISTCTHLGCIPKYRPDHDDVEKGWKGGFYCPCHGSKFDLAGRVYPGVPAPRNLDIPPYAFVDGNVIKIGVDPENTTKGAA
jgi:ubiquinol-cytochrome c reductase iron-sulfur subunit